MFFFAVSVTVHANRLIRLLAVLWFLHAIKTGFCRFAELSWTSSLRQYVLLILSGTPFKNNYAGRFLR